jgi:Holliday junction resolvase
MGRYDIEAGFERAIRGHFENEGYFVVRAAGSKGPVDLIAVRRSWLQPVGKIATVLFIRCKPPKRQREAFEENERTELIVLAAQYGAVPVWAERVGTNLTYKWLGYMNEMRKNASLRKLRH